MKSTCNECGKIFDPLVDKTIFANRCLTCQAPKGPDPKAVAKFSREKEIDELKGKIVVAKQELDCAKGDNDQHEVIIKRNRVKKLEENLRRLEINPTLIET